MGARTGAIALVIGLAVLAAGFGPPGTTRRRRSAALWQGAAGSWYALTSATLVRAVPLIVIGLGIALAFRGGAFNIGAEGQFYAGAIAATWVGLHVGGPARGGGGGRCSLAAMLAGAAWVVVPVWLRLRFGVLEVISTLLLNFVAESLVSLMVQGPLQEHSTLSRRATDRRCRAPAAASRHAASRGLRAGARDRRGGPLVPLHAYAVGLPAPGGRRWARARPRSAAHRRAPHGRLALLGSGALAGLAGGIEVSGVSYALYQNSRPDMASPRSRLRCSRGSIRSAWW